VLVMNVAVTGKPSAALIWTMLILDMGAFLGVGLIETEKVVEVSQGMSNTAIEGVTVKPVIGKH